MAVKFPMKTPLDLPSAQTYDETYYAGNAKKKYEPVVAGKMKTAPVVEMPRALPERPHKHIMRSDLGTMGYYEGKEQINDCNYEITLEPGLGLVTFPSGIMTTGSIKAGVGTSLSSHYALRANGDIEADRIAANDEISAGGNLTARQQIQVREGGDVLSGGNVLAGPGGIHCRALSATGDITCEGNIISQRSTVSALGTNPEFDGIQAGGKIVAGGKILSFGRISSGDGILAKDGSIVAPSGIKSERGGVFAGSGIKCDTGEISAATTISAGLCSAESGEPTEVANAQIYCTRVANGTVETGTLIETSAFAPQSKSSDRSKAEIARLEASLAARTMDVSSGGVG
jgi:hypothetical protein